MAYKHLEDWVLENNLMDSYFRVCNSAKDFTKILFPLTLDIAAYLKDIQLESDYVLFGGYGVLSHMIQDRGLDIATSWRGSKDIDIAGTKTALRAIKAEYEIITDRASPNFRDKRTLKLAINGRKFKIDFYMGNFEEKFFPPEIHTHLGVRLNVSNIFSLIRSKLNTHNRKIVHSTDINRLLAILSHRGYSAKDITKYFTSNQKPELLHKLKQGYNYIKRNGLDFDLMPNGDFKRNLEKELHKRKPILNF